MGGYFPSAALQVRPPENPLDQYAKALSVKSMLGQGELQQQSVQSGNIELQMKELALKNMQVTQSALSDPSLEDQFNDWQKSKKSPGGAVAGTPGGMAGVTLHPLAQFLAEKKGLPFMGQGGALDLSNTLTKSSQEVANLIKTQGDIQKTGLDNHAKQLDAFIDKAEPVLAETDPQKQATALGQLKNDVLVNSDLYPRELVSKIPSVNDAKGLAGLVNTGKMQQMLIEEGTKKAQEQTAQQAADPVTKLSTPEALAAPGASAAIQAKISDPKTNPADVPRLQLLLPKAEVAQNQVVNMKRRELLAQQAVTQGGDAGADALARMLVGRQITVDEMKVRGLTPQFEANVFSRAQALDPTWKAPEAAAQSRIAASASNQQFFGNTDSLLTKGGTLDQLSSAGKALGLTQLPALNTLENWRQAALGQGPQAAYAAAALGVADDYSKVMTGSGQGSDTSRLQALQIISKNLSPEGREAAIGQIRQQVNSQREGRVGSNPYLRDMYPHPTGGAEQTTHTPGGKAAGLTEGQTGTGSDGKKYIVKGGVWVPQ